MMNIKVPAFLLLTILAFSTPSYADSKEKKIEWSNVPHKAQKTITKYAQGGEIFKIKKEKIILITEKEKENKTTLYLAGVKKTNGKRTWITVDKSGKLIDIENEGTEEILEDKKK